MYLVICILHFLVQEIPTDKTGDFDMIYEFLEDNWEIIKWVALGVVILEVSIRNSIAFEASYLFFFLDCGWHT